ncbi:oxygen-independent coproporphyrinogen III oxidase [Legionella nautarum]|uniref:Heme chaperone HemW n=1 Tax=Legionella nautarum TaxID=45070 RepID=A0A0W0X340_9GAMM|nr:radical SAM family heme chaperone HemW [Legionella nautarum]KTD38934.1 oxygen-independent coproporphyrinogen III oxidase [Legionella nautarum]
MLPTSLYIHIPWCIRKCPYCDFNSHKSPDNLPEQQYIDALIADFTADLSHFPAREIQTIFIGGGTPSLLSADAYASLFTHLQKLVPFAKDIEITLEANPGTVEQERFTDYRQLGINRLSLGIQSFNPLHLKALGRIHDDQQAHKAIEAARNAGFANLNIDIMHGLPGQSILQGLEDLTIALSHKPEHLSWYQLTIEPNTIFYKQRPTLPNEDEVCLIEEQGLAYLAANGYQRYEISAFCRAEKYAQHNLNYWLFGDYYGIGAGAHGKITDENKQVFRTRKQRQPSDYLHPEKPFLAAKEQVDPSSLPFEYMLNTSRLEQAIPNALFSERTGLSFAIIEPFLIKAAEAGLISKNDHFWQITTLGRRYTNNLQAMFLPD